jgi:acetolactate synthase-1/2/3 large subunit
VAKAFGLPFQRCDTHSALEEAIRANLSTEGPSMCEIHLDLNQAFSPKLSSRKLEDGRMVTSSLEDMAPFLSKDELRENQIAPKKHFSIP